MISHLDSVYFRYHIGFFDSWLYKFTGLFFEGFGDHTFEKKSAVREYHTYNYCTVRTYMLREPCYKSHAALVIRRIKFDRAELF